MDEIRVVENDEAIVCPHCNFRDVDFGDYPEDGRYGCPVCGQNFLLSITIKNVYTTTEIRFSESGE